MSRVLAELLGTNEPSFFMGLRQMEQAAGNPGADIRLVLQIEHEVRAKLALLGLDPHGTTAVELFRALEEKLIHDEQAVRTALHINEGANVVELLSTVQRYITHETTGHKLFAVKASAMKALLKKLKPKATMKALGYRSMESMFKHEAVASLLLATHLCEDEAWQKARLTAYTKLQAKDFELRDASVVIPSGKKWPELAKRYTEANHHNQVTLIELGAIVMLPLDNDMPALAIVSIVLAFEAYELLCSRSTYLKLHQVQPGLGQLLAHVVDAEPQVGLSIGGQPLTWRLAHWFYGSGLAPYHPDLFEPHLQEEDFALADVHGALESLDEALSFWRGSHVLALLDESDPVSLNILDVALGVCNGLPFVNRVVHTMREALGRELVARYLHHDSLHAMLEESLGRQMAPEMVFDD